MDYIVEKVLYLFSSSLHGKLKSCIKGHIFCCITDNVLSVRVNYKDVSYTFSKENMIEGIDNGLSVEDVSAEIINDYKRILMKVFFIGGKEHVISNSTKELL